MTRTLCFAGALTAALLVAVPARAGETVWTSGRLAEGTRWETSYHVQDTGRPGPTIVIVGGMHGDEPAAAYAAGQIRHWPLRRGKMIVVPRANETALRAGKRYTPKADKALRNLNRNFPRAGGEPTARGTLAPAIWKLVKEAEPDWVLDLHEGYDARASNPKSVGASIIVADHPKVAKTVGPMLDAVNATITNERRRFVRLRQPVNGSLARAAAEHLGVPSMILESAKKGLAVSTRARQHRILVHRFLTDLGVLHGAVKPASVDYREGVQVPTAVGVYDGSGAFGRGVPNCLRQLGAVDGLAVARVGPTEIRAGALDGFDVVIFSGGTGGGQSRALGEKGRGNVRKFVRDGGGYVGICAGSYLATSGFSWGLKILDAKTVSPKWRRGRATVQLELTGPGRGLLGDRSGRFGVLYANGPILEPAGLPQLPDYETLALFRTEVAANGTPKGVMVDSPAILRGRYERGRVICFSPHPEQTKGLEDFVRRAVDWASDRAGD